MQPACLPSRETHCQQARTLLSHKAPCSKPGHIQQPSTLPPSPTPALPAYTASIPALSLDTLPASQHRPCDLTQYHEAHALLSKPAPVTFRPAYPAPWPSIPALSLDTLPASQHIHCQLTPGPPSSRATASPDTLHKPAPAPITKPAPPNPTRTPQLTHGVIIPTS